ncbi:unnamed protein product [Ostreobium quekettii]|uniref:Uncharacterized protein n=1 Tax=Ostreobium quekettii TaxID=121088 RepID=A0A8S1J8X0_9CHLO|nr:unnamed protein product [Ostreobium quekettii]
MWSNNRNVTVPSVEQPQPQRKGHWSARGIYQPQMHESLWRNTLCANVLARVDVGASPVVSVTKHVLRMHHGLTAQIVLKISMQKRQIRWYRGVRVQGCHAPSCIMVTLHVVRQRWALSRRVPRSRISGSGDLQQCARTWVRKHCCQVSVATMTMVEAHGPRRAACMAAAYFACAWNWLRRIAGGGTYGVRAIGQEPMESNQEGTDMIMKVAGQSCS